MIFHQEYVVFDLETTGLSFEHDAITEIGAAVYKDGKMDRQFQTFVEPQAEAAPEDRRAHGYHRRYAGGCPSAGGSDSRFSGVLRRKTAGGPQCGL